MMRQTGAILLDAYRELNARKLFWVVMGLSGLVVLIFALLGINERGMTFATWEFETPFTNTNVISKRDFYVSYFIGYGIAFWLGILASALALVSTASMIPDFIASGAIELSLSKPIGRLRLFLTKYLAALLFVVLQVGVFTLGGFLVLGLRGGVWVPSLFLAIPIVTLFFSYLYCVCALLGLLTRSSITSLLLTALFWGMLFLLQNAETGILFFKNMQEARGEAASKRIPYVERELQAFRLELERAEASDDPDATAGPRGRIDQREGFLADLNASIESADRAANTLGQWHTAARGAMLILPKTSETKELLDRWLVPPDAFEHIGIDTALEDAQDTEELMKRFESQQTDEMLAQQAAMATAEDLRDRPLWWVLGTSLAFEGVFLGFACWIFVRRDF